MSQNLDNLKTYRAINAPKPIQVGEDLSTRPNVVFVPQPQAVMAITDMWRIDDEWWRREPISRMYYDVVLVTGRQIVIYKDLINDSWYQQSYRS
ncbi:hypothetical protein ACFLWR_04780 [Chloroflexota bacterium]